jgi:hypothetical protein
VAKKVEPVKNELSDLPPETESVLDEAFADGSTGLSDSEKGSESEDRGTSGENISESTSGTDGQVQPKEESGDAGTSGSEDYKQQYLTLQGIYKKDKEEKETLTTKLDSLQAKLTEIEKLQEGTKTQQARAEKKKENLAEFLLKLYDDLPDEEKAELSKYDEEFDVVSKSEQKKRAIFAKKISSYIDEAIETSNKTLLNTLAPFLMASEKTSEETHFTSIKTAHPDYEKYRDDGSLKGWVDKQPKFLRTALQKVFDEGDTQDVIDLYSRFKKDNNIGTQVTTSTKTATQMDEKTQEKLQSQEIVDSGRKPVGTKSGVGNKEDFEGAFEEAAVVAGIK